MRERNPRGLLPELLSAAVVLTCTVIIIEAGTICAAILYHLGKLLLQ